MTNKEKLYMYVKLSKRIELLGQALEILEDEPFASGEPDNEEFCEGLRMRIEKLCDVSDKVEQELLAKPDVLKIYGRPERQG